MSKRHVEVLKAARKLIEIREHHYICDALQDYSRGDEILKMYVKQIRNQIKVDLGEHLSLAEWLMRLGIKVPEWDCNDDGESQYEFLRATRLAWIDALIEYWRVKP
ncbi:MAG: hypothetical protein WC714_29035 [Candidatus Obscuribacterales bacterium]|jgi:hypothetical protein